jgi:toxin ParE1/3/4
VSRSLSVAFSPEAEQDLLDLYTFIADRSGEERALSYVERIEGHCLTFGTIPERGTCRNDLRSGLRVTGFERRVTIAFHITGDSLVIDRILYGGRSLDLAIDPEI